MNWFIEGTEVTEEPVLAGGKCENCGKVVFPRKTVCPRCGTSGRMSVFPLDRRTKLLGYGVALRGSTYLEGPYAFGYVMSAEGVKIYSLFVECEPYTTKLKTGAAMEVVALQGKNATTGEKSLFYAFRPVLETQ